MTPRKAIACLSLIGLAACQSLSETDSTGRVIAGPLGQAPNIAPQVEPAIKAAISACIDNATTGAALPTLAAAGFEPSGSGFSLRYANPNTTRPGRIRVGLGDKTCGVSVTPAWVAESATMTTLTNEVLAARQVSVPFDVVPAPVSASDYRVTVAFPRGDLGG